MLLAEASEWLDTSRGCRLVILIGRTNGTRTVRFAAFARLLLWPWRSIIMHGFTPGRGDEALETYLRKGPWDFVLSDLYFFRGAD
jgi:hypothetical protein